MFARSSRFDWAPKSWAMLLVVGLHLVFAMLLLNARHIRIERPVEAIQVSFMSEVSQPETDWQPPTPPIAVKMDTQLTVPPPEVKVAAAPTAIRATVVETAPAAAEPGIAANSPRLVSEIEYLREPAARYPAASRRLREQGTVVLRVLVDETGHASHVDVHRSSGFPRLDAAACEAVREARFKPYVYDGRAQATLVMVPIEFALRA